MKKATAFFFIFYISLLQIFANSVTKDEAQEMAERFIQQNLSDKLKSSGDYTLTDIGDIFSRNSLKSTSDKPLYIFNVSENNGFVIVAGDDAARPILGYSNTGQFDPNNIPSNTMKWLEGYKQQVDYIGQNKIAQTEEIRTYWEGTNRKLKASTSVDPLIHTKWNQSPFFNDLCPYDADYQELTVTGCPATAMAQIMKYWGYPAQGSGFHSFQHSKYGMLSANMGAAHYNWDAMPNEVTEENLAIATLMYHCGVAVEMMYNVASEGGSGSYVIKDEDSYSDNQTVENALTEFFGYSSDIEGIKREDFTDAEWIEILKEELSSGRPIQYAGYGQGGHTFVCDGYDENDFFHMNWGWGGYADAYYLIDALEPGDHGIGAGAGSYNNGQQALIGIHPPTDLITYDLNIYNDVTISANTIDYGSAFSITTNIINNGMTTFNGDYCAAVFDDNDAFIDFIEIESGYTLAPDNVYNDNIEFSTDGLLSLLPGNYFIGIFYRPTDGNWNVLNTETWDLFTADYVQLEVVNDNPISLYSPITILTEDIYTDGELEVLVDVANLSDSDYDGVLDLSVYDIEGNYVTTVEEMYIDLPADSHFEDGIYFYTDNIGIEAGTYYLAFMHQWDGGDYEITGSMDNYINPIRIVVQTPPYEPDIYEDNQVIENASPLAVQFEDANAIVIAEGANLHTGSDWDYYSIDLEDGYNYNIDLGLFDEYNPLEEENYSVDALFLYSLDGNNWSDMYDDIMPSKINLTGENTLYVVVSPYYRTMVSVVLQRKYLARSGNKSK